MKLFSINALAVIVLACVFSLCSCKSEIKNSYTLDELREASFFGHDEVSILVTGLSNKDFDRWDSVKQCYYDTPCELARIIDEKGKRVRLIIGPEDSLTYIGNNSFLGCKNLVSVVVPPSVTKLGMAFIRCDQLQKVFLPTSVEQIEDVCFGFSNKLRSFEFIGNFKFLGDALFFKCKNISDVTLPSSLRAVPECLFDGCPSLKSITIPDSVVVIDSWAFYESGLKSVTIPASVRYIGFSAFGGCDSLTEVVFLGNRDSIYIEPDAFVGTPVYEDFAMGEVPAPVLDSAACKREVSLGYFCDIVSQMPSDTVLSYSLRINDSTFCSSWERISDVLHSENCAKVNLTLLPDSNFHRVQNFKFIGAKPLKSIALPEGVKYIGMESFLYSDIESISLPNTLTNIFRFGLGECEKLKSVKLPESMSKIHEYTFFSDISLDSVMFSDNMYVIANNVFEDCHSLKYVSYSRNLRYVDNEAFLNCKSLKQIELPSNILYIGYNAFKGCDSLQKVLIHADRSSVFVAPDAFEDCKSLSPENIVFLP